MKMSGLDREEQEILDAFNAGELKRSDNFHGRIEKHKQYAESVLRKDARMNIRLSRRDLENLQALALADGIPYQTFVASILHKYVEGRLREE